MAERYLIASGNVSDPANWFGGNKPTVGDVAHANGFIGTIDEDISADTWTTAAGATAVAGGGFVLLDGFTLTGDVASGTTNCVTYTGSSEATVAGDVTATVGTGVVHDTASTGHLTIDGHVTGGTSSGTRGVIFRPNSPLGAITITGTVKGGTGADSSQGLLIENSPAGENRVVTILGNAEANVGHGVNFNGKATLIIGGHMIGGPAGGTARGVNQSGNFPVRAGQRLIVFGSVFSTDTGGGVGYLNSAGHENQATIYGSVISQAASGIIIGAASVLKLTVHGGASGGLAPAIDVFGPSASVDVRGYVVGGRVATAHGILNQSTSPIRVGGQSITNPSGALGISNPGGGDVTTEYLSEMDPAYLPEVRAAEGGKVLVTLLKNSVNASTLVTGTPTVDIRDFARDSVIGGPQALTLEDGVYSYQHPTNVMTPRKLYYARVEAVMDDEARDLMERPFVAQ